MPSSNFTNHWGCGEIKTQYYWSLYSWPIIIKSDTGGKNHQDTSVTQVNTTIMLGEEQVAAVLVVGYEAMDGSGKMGIIECYLWYMISELNTWYWTTK